MTYKVIQEAQEEEGRLTGVLIFSIIISCFGNAFLYGYQIGVVNQPADLIRDFYNKTYYERKGGNWESMVNYDNYLQENITDEKAIIEYEIDTKVQIQNGSVIGVNETKRLQPELFGADKSLLLSNAEIDFLYSTTVAAFVLFGMIGAFTSAKVADFFGRKRGMIVITFLMFIAAVFGGITKVVSSPECLILSRVLVGLHSGLNITLCPLYLAEISPKKIRGAVGTCFQLFITVGILVSQIFGLPDLLGTVDRWPLLFAFNAIPSLVCLVAMPFCPESPRWLLIKKGEEEEARSALERLRGHTQVSDEVMEMRLEASKSVGVKNYTIKELILAKDLRMPVIIACVLQISQQWSGINAVMSYSAILFKLVSVSGDLIPYIVVGTGTINVLMTIIAVPLMEKAGRRPLLLYPTVAMLISFIIMTVFLHLQDKPEYADQRSAFAITCIILMHTYIIGFALGLGPIPFIVVGEIFRQEPRAAAMSLSLAFNWICNFILMWTFPFLQAALQEFVYVIFCIILILALVFIFFFVPETKNKTFDEVANSIALGRAHGKQRAYGINSDETTPMDTSKV